jgi:hypothetical protein
MTKTAITLDLLETIRDYETTGAGVAKSAVATPVVIGTTADIGPGSVLIKSDAQLPQSVSFGSKQYGAWKLLTGVDGFAVERRLSEVGWHFFFVVPETKAAAVSSTRHGAVRKALEKVMVAVEAQNFNGLEIVGITLKHFLRLHCVRIVAHPRYIKHSPFLRDLDPHHVSRNAWDFKRVLRRRGQIGRTSKAI